MGQIALVQVAIHHEAKYCLLLQSTDARRVADKYHVRTWPSVPTLLCCFSRVKPYWPAQMSFFKCFMIFSTKRSHMGCSVNK